MAMVVRVKPEYNGKIAVQSSNSYNGIILSNDLSQATLVQIYNTEDELRDFLYTTYTTVGDSYAPSQIDPSLIHAYASEEITHNPAKTDYPANTVGKLLNENSTNLDTVVKGFQRPTQKVAHILDFANARMIDASYFTRNSVATYIDKNGVLRVASANQPRFIHNAMTLESLGLLIEPSRTNLLTYSTDLSTWTRGGSTSYVGASTLLGYSAHTFTNSAIANAFVAKVAAVTFGKTYTYSYISSSTTISHIRLVKSNGGVVMRSLNNFVITQLAIGVYKHEISFTVATDEDTAFLHAGPVDKIETFTIGMTQLEEGSYSTSYIPTSAVSVTRDAEVFNMSSNAFAKVFDSYKEGALAFSYTVIGANECTVCELRGPDTTGWNVVRIMATQSNCRYDNIKDGTTTATLVSNTPVATQNNVVVNFGFNISTMYLNGALTGSANTVDMPQNIDRVKIFSQGILIVKNIYFYKRTLSDTESKQLSNTDRKYSSKMDFSNAAFIDKNTLLAARNRQEFSIDGTGASVTRNIRRGYDFTFEIVDSSGCTITAQPASSCTAGTDNALTFTAPVGKTLTYAITPVFEY